MPAATATRRRQRGRRPAISAVSKPEPSDARGGFARWAGSIAAADSNGNSGRTPPCGRKCASGGGPSMWCDTGARNVRRTGRCPDAEGRGAAGSIGDSTNSMISTSGGTSAIGCPSRAGTVTNVRDPSAPSRVGLVGTPAGGVSAMPYRFQGMRFFSSSNAESLDPISRSLSGASITRPTGSTDNEGTMSSENLHVPRKVLSQEARLLHHTRASAAHR